MIIIHPQPVLAVCLVVAYLVLVRSQRYRRRSKLQRKHNYATEESLGKMTMDDAASIQKELAEMEFPFSFINAMEFALFRTYGIPTVSTLLVSTREITNLDNIAKRLADTGALMFEIEGSLPSSERWSSAVARMNYIHGVYQSAGKISNSDLLYTLSLFASEPLKWVSRYEWRDLTEMETAAIGTFWKGVGEAMNVSFDGLPSYQKGWRNGNHWLDEILAWSQNYEEQHMVPHEDNHRLAVATIDYILWPVPKSLMHLGYKAFQSMMDDRLHMAMKLQKPSHIWFFLTRLNLFVRKLVLRHLALPRPEIWRARYLSAEPNKHGRFYSHIYGGLPIYIEPSFSWRYNVQAWIFWALGKPVPGDDDKKYLSKGYDIREVGPDRMMRKGSHEMDIDRQKIAHLPRCPFRT